MRVGCTTCCLRESLKDSLRIIRNPPQDYFFPFPFRIVLKKFLPRILGLIVIKIFLCNRLSLHLTSNVKTFFLISTAQRANLTFFSILSQKAVNNDCKSFELIIKDLITLVFRLGWGKFIMLSFFLRKVTNQKYKTFETIFHRKNKGKIKKIVFETF